MIQEKTIVRAADLPCALNSQGFLDARNGFRPTSEDYNYVKGYAEGLAFNLEVALGLK